MGFHSWFICPWSGLGPWVKVFGLWTPVVDSAFCGGLCRFMGIGLSPGHGPWVNVFGLLNVSSFDCAVYYVLCRVMFLVYHWDLARGLKSFDL